MAAKLGSSKDNPLPRDRYVVKPLPNPEGKRGFRLEIDEFIADNAMTNLFLLAIADMQKDSLKEVWVEGKNGGPPELGPDFCNFYALATIHMEPFEIWDGYAQPLGKDPKTGADIHSGYCSHSMQSFPTFHRPYMLLFEQCVYNRMKEIAEEFNKTDKTWGAKYLDAAERFRLPYWDLVMPRNEPAQGEHSNKIWACPALFKAEKVWVRKPDNPKKLVEIQNPMHHFDLPPASEFERTGRLSAVESMRKLGFNTQKTTRNEKIDQTFQEQAGIYATKLGQMLRTDQVAQAEDGGKTVNINEVRPWGSFAADHSDPDKYQPGQFDAEQSELDQLKFATVSLESWHNALHDLCGLANPTAGAVGNPAVAAFDPIFFMLHCNVDRVLSLYQCLYPDKWLPGPKGTKGQDPDEELHPFRKGPGDKCYTSNDEFVRHYWEPGFAVPGDKKLDPDAAKELVKEYITNTYYWADTTNPKPGSLPNWPKKENLAKCEALTGKAEDPNATPIINIGCISQVNGKPTLVTQPISILEEANPEPTITKIGNVLEQVANLDKALPGAAFLVNPFADALTKQQTWNAHVRVKKYVFNGPFKIDFFLGEPDDQTDLNYACQKNQIGMMAVFASGSDTKCANCQQKSADGIFVEDVVPFTPKLLEYIQGASGGLAPLTTGLIKVIQNLSPDIIVPFLREQLKWRITDLHGNIISGKEKDAGLEVTIACRDYTSPTPANLLGTYGPLKAYPDATSNKPGGLGSVFDTLKAGASAMTGGLL